MSGYTEGPWHWVNSATDEPYDFFERCEHGGYASLRTVEEFGLDKTEIIDGKSYTSFALPVFILDADPLYESDLHNANLIKSAPDLLEALEGVLRVADRATMEFDAARAAIAKAKGEQP